MSAMSKINLAMMAVCIVVTVLCYLRLATAAIALACSGDQIGVVGGCNDAAIEEATAEGLISQTKPVFEYVGGKVTGLPSGFFYTPR